MKPFQFINESQHLDEKIVVISQRGSPDFPRYGQVYILAGGGGSGKGFFIQNFLHFQGKKFNVDDFKKAVMKSKSKIIHDKFLLDTGRSLESISLHDPFDVSILHDWIKKSGWAEKQQDAFFASVSERDYKPNILFDVTLKDISDFQKIVRTSLDAGYEPSNIHLVWVLNDLNVALKHNKDRARQVDIDILFKAHEGVAMTISKILKDSKLSGLNGNVLIFFAQTGIDNFIETHFLKNGKKFVEAKGYNVLFVKKRNSQIEVEPTIKKEILEKIRTYIPQTVKDQFDF